MAGILESKPIADHLDRRFCEFQGFLHLEARERSRPRGAPAPFAPVPPRALRRSARRCKCRKMGVKSQKIMRVGPDTPTLGRIDHVDVEKRTLGVHGRNLWQADSQRLEPSISRPYGPSCGPPNDQWPRRDGLHSRKIHDATKLSRALAQSPRTVILQTSRHYSEFSGQDLGHHSAAQPSHAAELARLLAAPLADNLSGHVALQARQVRGPFRSLEDSKHAYYLPFDFKIEVPDKFGSVPSRRPRMEDSAALGRGSSIR